MKSLSKAIELARKNGWEEHLPKFVINTTVILNPDLLDPLFWQALGKALGWKGITGRIYNREAENSYDTLSEPLYQMHRFIDHLAEGKDAESFFNNLLPHDL